jgi:hypothetical protein
MKKSLMLLMLGFVFSFGAYAHNEVKKENDEQISKPNNKILTKAQAKLYTEFCMEAHVFIGECPDGSEFVGAVAYILSDCDSGQVYGVGVDWISSVDESC